MKNKYTYQLLALLYFFTSVSTTIAQINNNCANASEIVITNNGWDYGVFNSIQVDLTPSTLQVGEYVPPSQIAQDKSVWYKFSIPTTRNIRITLQQPGPPYLLNSTDAGWTLFNTQNCLPVDTNVIDPPILNIEGYEHKCLEAGEYLIQVTGKLTANGPISIVLESQKSTATEIDYDDPNSPYNFGILSGTTGYVYYDVGCQSIFEGERLCPDTTYTKSTWQIFTTDAYVDYVRFEITENPWNSFNTSTRNIGYVLYEGNVIIDTIADDGPGLNSIDTCKTLSFINNGQYGSSFNACELKPNTTYSIQLLFAPEYSQRIRMRMYEVGTVPTLAPDPVAIPPSQQLGILPLATDVYTTDYFSCNSLLSDNNCGGKLEDTVFHSGNYFDMGYWYTFEILTDANLTLDLRNYYGCQPTILYQIFNGDVMNDSCNLPLLGNHQYDYTYKCLPAGKYSVRVLGRYNPSQGHTCSSSLADGIRFRLRVDQVALMQYGLFTPSEYENINGGVALTSGNTYTSTIDYFDCRTTVIPDTVPYICGNLVNRAIYRVVTVGQDGIITLGGGNNYFNYKFYEGDASTLPILNGVIQGLTDLIGCQPLLYHPSYHPKVCVTPGKYTLVSFGDESDVTRGDNPWIKFESFLPTSFTDPLSPETMPVLGTINNSITATPTRFNCNDNPLTILGYTPCSNATKQIYHEFYLDSAASIQFTTIENEYSNTHGTMYHRIFKGRISTNSLTSLLRNCFSSFNQSICDTTPVGWYTVVTYANGNTFSTNSYTNGYGQSIGDQSSFTISINTSPTAQFNTFADAEQVNGGTAISWGANGPHTAQIPYQQKTYTLGTEYFVCADDAPFPTGITSCNVLQNRVSYRVFTLDKPSFTYIYNLNPSPYVYQSKLYAGDITAQIAPFSLVQDCISDQIRLCLAAGTYTLATFGTNSSINRTHTPIIYLDSLGTSKFDHNATAYEFGNIPNDNVMHWGNILDPLDAFGRNPSNDFIFCSTSSSITDPKSNLCYLGTELPGNVLPAPTNPRQNLWYTFEITGAGNVTVNVNTLTSGKTGNLPFAIYKASALGDSTIAGGLEFVASSRKYWWCTNYNDVSFYRDPCSASGTDRYYILVDRPDGYLPNVQLEVGIKFAPAPPTFILYDHYSQANYINGNPTTTCIGPYANDTINIGTYTGCLGNLNCATKDVTDQNSCGNKTLWYKFNVGSTGMIRINYDRTNGSTVYNGNDIQLYKSLVNGDSTSGGLVRVPLSSMSANNNPDFNNGTNYNYGEGCMTPGTYYIMFTGCTYPTETVLPRIWLLPQWGDLCADPAIITADTAGLFSQNININCFSLGEAPGEDGTNMGCLGSPIGMKTAWFKVNLNDSTSKMDVDIEILENTNVTGDKIKYRIAYGDCDGMTFDNCVSGGIFIVLNLKCRPIESTIWVQVIMPEYATGDITLNATLTPVSDTNCIVINPERPRADFDYSMLCLDDAVIFTNNSTSGDSMTYYWDFGDGFTSTIEDPIHTYLTADTFLVMLVADNGSLSDTLYRLVIINEKPNTYFTTDVILNSIFLADSITFNNLSTGAIATATYYWDFCAGATCGGSIPSYVGIDPPKIKYNIAGEKTICLTISNGTCDSTYCYSFTVYNKTIFAGGSYDGHDVSFITDSCNISVQNIFIGGPYDGHDNAFLTDSCSTFTVNIFGGGPYDGHDNSFLTDSCSSFEINIYAGGSYDGHDSKFITDSCANINLNIYAGGPYDGHDNSFLTDSCSTFEINIYAGGPYDGHDNRFLTDSCPNGNLNIFAGGPYDGHDNNFITDSCPIINLNIFAGGPYDGHEIFVMYCDTIPVIPPDSTFCDTCKFAGGPYDGAAVAYYTDSCLTTIFNIFAGGPYDGHDVAFITDSCNSFQINLFAGGPYDGHDNGFLTDSCSNININIFAGGPYDGHDNGFITDSCTDFIINLFAGGPYDGHDNGFLTDSCSNFIINVFAGGPYDGHDTEFLTDSCSDFVINVFAGGPYDGHDVSELSFGPTQPFSVQNDTTCIGNSAILVATAPTNWYTFNGTEYLIVQVGDSTYTTAVFTTAGKTEYFVDNPFGCEKISVSAIAYDTIYNPEYLATVFCEGDVSSFTNQTVVPDAATPSFGSAGFDINLVGATGIPPGATQISFSSIQTLNYPNLYNGVNDQNNGWVANNSGAGTEWIQWNYLNPKSVNNFIYMPRNTCCADNAPTQLRLYYDLGTGWQLAKTIIPTYPSINDFDSGFIIETANIYANRWKLEADVLQPNSPQWGEFQVYASSPIIGGNTFWDFGDGNTSTLQNPTHTYAMSGSYTVTLTVDVPGLLCPSVTTQAINVCINPILSVDLIDFTAEVIDGQRSVLCNWKTLLNDNTNQFEIQRSADGFNFENIGRISSIQGIEFEFLDTNALGGKSYYRVIQTDIENELHYSTVATVYIDDELNNSISLYPNPTFDKFTIDILASENNLGKQLEMVVFNILGQPIIINKIKLSEGNNYTTFDLSEYPQGTYMVSFKGLGKPVYYKVVKLK